MVVLSRGRLLVIAGLVLAVVVVAALVVVLTRSGGEEKAATTAEETGSVANAERISTIKADDYHSLVFNPTDPNTVYFGHHNGIMRSQDGGRTWQKILDQPNSDGMSLVIHPARPQVIYSAGHNNLMRSDDGGMTWHRMASNLPGLDIHAFAIHPKDPDHLYAFVVGYGLFHSKDGGGTWELLNAKAPVSTLSLVVIPGNPDVLMLGSGDQGVLRSNDGGATWQAASNIVAVKMDYVASSDTLYMATLEGIFRGSEGGSKWSKVALDRPVMALAISPTDQSNLLAITDQGQVYRVKDNPAVVHP